MRRLVAVFMLLLGGVATARAQQAPVVEYYHVDALGSVRAVTNQDGDVVRQHDYFPFGDEYLASVEGDSRRFTGKQHDAETGLDYFGARYYSSWAGRFGTEDPILNIEASIRAPQQWNRYGYVLNNPLRFVDPDGREIKTPEAFQQSAFAQQNRLNLRAFGKALMNVVLSINVPSGNMTPEASAQHYYQADSADEAKRMLVFDLLLATTPAMFSRGGSATAQLSETILTADRVGSALKTDLYHAVAGTVTRQELEAGRVFRIVGGDERTRSLLQTLVVREGKAGVVEYIVQDGVVTHQRFIPGGVITGTPNQKPQ